MVAAMKRPRVRHPPALALWRGLVLGLVVGLGFVPALAPRVASAAGKSQELVIFEAASLKDVFARLAQRFEKEHPGTKVVTNAAGSQELRTQIEHGAAADVFASADRKHMDALAAQGLVVSSVGVHLQRAGGGGASGAGGDHQDPRRSPPRGADRDRHAGGPDRKLHAADPGKGDRQIRGRFRRASQAKVASRELNVRQVLAKVVLGEADAGVVYRSDAVSAAGKVQVLPIPPELNVTAEYPIAI